MVWGCRSIGRVGSRWDASRQAGGFCDPKLGLGPIQLVGSATRRGQLDEGKRMWELSSRSACWFMDTVFTPICEYRWMKYHCQYTEGHKAEGLSYIDHLSKCPYQMSSPSSSVVLWATLRLFSLSKLLPLLSKRCVICAQMDGRCWWDTVRIIGWSSS